MFLKNPSIKSYIIEALKTWRKQNAAMILSTQSLDELRKSEILDIIIESCPTKIFLAKPFLVSAIYHDETFTYVKCAASEKPAIYEIKDGKPNLINFELQNGVYIVPKIVDTGYLAVGKKKLAFSRHQ